MSDVEWLSKIGAQVGERARASMLLALGDGRALPAGELAACAEVSAPTASGHLARMMEAGLVVGAEASRPAIGTRVDPTLRKARACYNHLGGQLGVGICDAMLARHQ